MDHTTFPQLRHRKCDHRIHKRPYRQTPPGKESRERLEPLREALADAGSEWGASALDGFLVARFLSPDAATLRADLARLAIHLTGRKLPRSWQN